MEEDMINSEAAHGLHGSNAGGDSGTGAHQAGKSDDGTFAKDIDEIDEEENEQEAGTGTTANEASAAAGGSKGWMSNLHRESRVGENDFQATIPPMLFSNEKHHTRILSNYRVQRKPFLNELQVYQRPGKVSEAELKEYLRFANSISLKDSKSDSEGLLIGLPSANQVEANALNFLAKCEYSIVRAKFFLVFPTIMFYNAYKANKANPVQLSDAEMSAKVDQFVNQLQETKLGQHEKWRLELQEIMQTRNHVAKIHQHLENGKLMRYEVPDSIKEAFDKAHKFSKELKKVMADRASLEKLEAMLETANNDHKIVTNEMVQFEQGLMRCKEWLSKVEPLYTERDRISLKVLSGLIAEYKSIPVKCIRFEEKFKKVYEASVDLIERIPNFARISKTRGMNVQEPIKIEAAVEIMSQISKLNVYCDEFDSFEYALIFSLEKINNLMMFLNDDRQVFTLDTLKQLKTEATELNFYSKVSDQISDLYDYLKLIEKVKKQINEPNKLSSLLEDITKGEERGFRSLELTQLKAQITSSISWFENLEKLVIEKKPLNEKKLFNQFKLDASEYMKPSILQQMQEETTSLSIDAASQAEFTEICKQIQSWKDSWNTIKGPANKSQGSSDDKMVDESAPVIVAAPTSAPHTRGSNISSFDGLLKFIQKGLTFGIASAELLESIDYYKRGVLWAIQCISFVNEYRDTPLKSDLLSESLIGIFTDIANKQRIPDFDAFKTKKSFEKLAFLLEQQKIPFFCRNSNQYQALLKIQRDVEDSEREVQAILALNLEETQELDHFEVVDLIPKLDSKQLSLPIDKSKNEKLCKVYVLQKWGKAALNAQQFIKEESSEGRRLQDLLKKQGIVEFSAEVDSLAQRLLSTDLSTFISDCQTFWAKFSPVFTQLLDAIHRNPLRDINVAIPNPAEDSLTQHQISSATQNQSAQQQWDYQSLKTLLKNGQNLNLNLKNSFLKLHNEISTFVDQTDSWIDSFYSNTFFKRTIISKDGKKVIKKQGLKIDELKTLIVQDDDATVAKQLAQNETKISSSTIWEEETGKNSVAAANVPECPTKNSSLVGSSKIVEEVDDVMKEEDDVMKEEDDVKKEEDPVVLADLVEEQKEQQTSQQTTTQQPQQSQVSLQAKPSTSKQQSQPFSKSTKENAEERKLMKLSKMNTLNYYLGQPMILITFFQGLARNIHNQEMIMAQNRLSELFKYKTKAAELLRTKPTLEEMKSYLQRGENLSCYMPEQSVMKKISKWAHDWLEIARKVLDSISKNKKYLNNTKVKSKAVLPSDFSEDLYSIAFDAETFVLNIKRKPVQTFKHHNPHARNGDKSFFQSDLESQIKFLNKKNTSRRRAGEPHENYKQRANSNGSISSANVNEAPLVSSKRGMNSSKGVNTNSNNNILNQNYANLNSHSGNTSYRPKRATSIPKHYLDGEYLLNSVKFNPEVKSPTPVKGATTNSNTATATPTTNTAEKPSKSRNKESVIQIEEAEFTENKKRRYVRKPPTTIDSFESSEPTKKRIVYRKDQSSNGNREETQTEELMNTQKSRKKQISVGSDTPALLQQLPSISIMNNNNSSVIEYIEEDENMAYCICRGYSGEESIGCDGCQDWFHFSCNGLKPQLGNQIKKFYCMACCSRFYRPYLNGHKTEFIWDAIEKISLDLFNEIVKEGLILPLQMKEIDEILELKVKVDEQLLEMNKLISRGPEILKTIELYECGYKLEREEGPEYEKVKKLLAQEKETDLQLFQCYLAHFGFPVEFEQADALLQMIQRRDFVRQLLRHLYSNNLDLLEIFFTQGMRLFDLNRIVGVTSDKGGDNEILFLYKHVKSVFENSLEAKKTLLNYSTQKVSLETYVELFNRIERDCLIVPNVQDTKRKVAEFREWQREAQELIMTFETSNRNDLKPRFLDNVNRSIDTYDRKSICLSKMYPMLKSVKETLTKEAAAALAAQKLIADKLFNNQQAVVEKETINLEESEDDNEDEEDDNADDDVDDDEEEDDDAESEIQVDAAENNPNIINNISIQIQQHPSENRDQAVEVEDDDENEEEEDEDDEDDDDDEDEDDDDDDDDDDDEDDDDEVDGNKNKHVQGKNNGEQNDSGQNKRSPELNGMNADRRQNNPDENHHEDFLKSYTDQNSQENFGNSDHNYVPAAQVQMQQQHFSRQQQQQQFTSQLQQQQLQQQQQHQQQQQQLMNQNQGDYYMNYSDGYSYRQTNNHGFISNDHQVSQHMNPHGDNKDFNNNHNLHNNNIQPM